MAVRCLPRPGSPPSLCPGPSCLPCPQDPDASPEESPVRANGLQVGALLLVLLPLSLLCPSPPAGAPMSTAGRKAGPGTGLTQMVSGSMCSVPVSPCSSVRLRSSSRGRQRGSFPFPRCLQEASSHAAPPNAPGALHFSGHPGRFQAGVLQSCQVSPRMALRPGHPARPALHSGPCRFLAQWANAGLAESREQEPLPPSM